MSVLHALQRSLVKRLILGSTILVCLLYAAVWQLVSQYMHQQMHAEVVKRANTTLQSVQIGIHTFESPGNVARLVNALAAGEDIEKLIVVKQREGVAIVAAAHENSWIGGLAETQLSAEDWDHIKTALQTRQAEAHEDTESGQRFEAVLPIIMRSDDQRNSVEGAIYVTISTTRMQAQTQRHVLSITAQLFGLICITGALLYAFLQHNVLSPLEALRQAMLQHTTGDQIVYAPVARLDEIGQLSQTYNQLRDAVQSYETRLKVILNTVVDGVITVDDSEHILSFTRSAERIFGYSASEVIGKPVAMLMPHDYSASQGGYRAIWQQANQNQRIGIGHELQALRKNGECFTLELSVGQARDGAKNIYVGIVRDITERKKIEQLKNEFISTVSHELRTPLTSIRGSLGLLTTDTFASLPPKAHKLINLAHRNCERLVLLINDILDVEKMTSGQLSVHVSEQDVATLMQQAMELNQGYGDRHGVLIKLTNPSAHGLKVMADSDRLMQVFANLLSNAIKFSPSGSEVHLRASPFEGMVRFAVQDFGAGIPEEFRSRIFQKFAQADGTSTRTHEGSGLGLSITRHLVEAMQGRIDYVSTPGRGSTFMVDLPMATATKEA